jgi:hypothetical protein
MNTLHALVEGVLIAHRLKSSHSTQFSGNAPNPLR